MNFAAILQTEMNKKKLTQDDLRKKIGVSQVIIHKWLRGYPLPSKANFEKLKKVFRSKALNDSWELRRNFNEKVKTANDEQLRKMLEVL